MVGHDHCNFLGVYGFWSDAVKMFEELRLAGEAAMNLEANAEPVTNL